MPARNKKGEITVRPRHSIDVMPADAGQWEGICTCSWAGETRKRFASAQRDAAKHLRDMRKRRGAIRRSIEDMKDTQ